MPGREQLVRDRIAASIAAKQELLEGDHVAGVLDAADRIEQALRAGGKVLFCGNGGSAADATHLAAELVGRFRLDRAPLAAVALADNLATLTAVSNDYAFDDVFARQVRGLGRPGDVLVALSTSGGSPNVVAAVDAARESGLVSIALTGTPGGEVAERADLALRLPGDETARVQEATMLVGHTLCELVESALG